MELKKILEEGVAQGASDIHITPNSCPVLRVNGKLVPLTSMPVLNAEMTSKIVFSCLEKEQRAIFEEKKEFDFSIIENGMASFRVNAFYQTYGIAAVFRVIASTIPTLEDINSPPVFNNLLSLHSGLIIVAGPTGCGKSTTLAAMINYMNTQQAKHIITIEDPIEFTHKNNQSLINQRQVHRDTRGFSNALRAALREDPNVILVGEMRDLETIRLALTAAETGHLVMATLHTSSAPRAVSRIIDVFPEGEKNIIKNMISESLQAVICQQLLTKKTGGRIAAFEIMLGTPAIRNLIREDKIAQMYSVIQTSSDKGMVTMDQSVQTLVDDGVVELEAAHGSGFQRELFEKL